jgi:hypothetical protein
VTAAADRFLLELRNADASVASALPGASAASAAAAAAAAAAAGSPGGLFGSGPPARAATNRLLSLLINAVRVGVEAYAAAVCMLSARVAHLLISLE